MFDNKEILIGVLFTAVGVAAIRFYYLAFKHKEQSEIVCSQKKQLWLNKKELSSTLNENGGTESSDLQSTALSNPTNSIESISPNNLPDPEVLNNLCQNDEACSAAQKVLEQLHLDLLSSHNHYFVVLQVVVGFYLIDHLFTKNYTQKSAATIRALQTANSNLYEKMGEIERNYSNLSTQLIEGVGDANHRLIDQISKGNLSFVPVGEQTNPTASGPNTSQGKVIDLNSVKERTAYILTEHKSNFQAPPKEKVKIKPKANFFAKVFNFFNKKPL